MTGEYTENEAAIAGLDGRWTITEQGVVRSYDRSGHPTILTQKLKNGRPIIRVFKDFEVTDWKVADLVAITFLGTDRYIHKDSDLTNVALSNLMPIHEALQPDERWIDDFEGQYAVTKTGSVYSFKRGVRRLLKSCKSLSKSERICLTGMGEQVTVYIDHLVEEYFGTTLSGSCTVSNAN